MGGELIGCHTALCDSVGRCGRSNRLRPTTPCALCQGLCTSERARTEARTAGETVAQKARTRYIALFFNNLRMCTATLVAATGGGYGAASFRRPRRKSSSVA